MRRHREYHRPTTLREAWQLQAEVPGARFIAGGTDLLVQMRKRRIKPPPALISLRNVRELGDLSANDQVRIGAGVPLADIVRHPAIRAQYPALVESIRVVGSRQIRNVATVGGNLCNASPAADTAPALLTYDARVELQSNGATREVPVAELFEGPGQTTLRPGEILTAVVLDPPAPQSRSVFLRKGRVKMDLAIVSVAVLVEIEDGGTCRRAAVAAGAVAPVPLRLPRAEAILQGTRLTPEEVDAASNAAMESVSPITDLRSTAAYRRHLVGVFVRRAVEQLLRQPRGEEG